MARSVFNLSSTSTGTKLKLAITVQHMFINDIRCDDRSIKVIDNNGDVSGEKGPYLDLSVSLDTDESVSSVLEFSFDEEAAGEHLLQVVPEVTGVLFSGEEKLNALPLPGEVKGVLVTASSAPNWETVYEEALLTFQNGLWVWEPVNDCGITTPKEA